MQLKRERVELADLVAKAVEMTSPAIEARRHRLLVDVPRGLAVEGDPARLAQVVANLLTNAAKYTESGGTIEVNGSAADGEVRLEVTDTGIGIGPEMLPRVFDLFMQERQGIDRSEGGLGLGLAIVRSLVSAHGGSVTAASRGAGFGATFTVELPAAPASLVVETEEKRAPDGPSGGFRVLVVDDNRDAAELLADSLRALGHVVAVAFDGPSGLEAASRFEPDVALLDLGLPMMDGFELARRLRAHRPRPGLRLVAITGYGQVSDRQKSSEAGFDAHLVKPVDVRELHSLILAP
ncbi:MAG: ATP-binding protein [Acidobacteriota bacterium]